MNLPLLAFVFIGLFTPGPNVVMLANSGAAFGIKRSLPHLLGVVVGVGIIGTAVGFGFGNLLQAFPGGKLFLRGISVVWILYLAFKLYRSSRTSAAKGARPFHFFEAVLFQWVNPKIWAVALVSLAFVADQSPKEQAIALALSFSGVNLFVCLFWTCAGKLLSMLLTEARHWKIFTTTMAILLAFTTIPLLFIQ